MLRLALEQAHDLSAQKNGTGDVRAEPDGEHNKKGGPAAVVEGGDQTVV